MDAVTSAFFFIAISSEFRSINFINSTSMVVIYENGTVATVSPSLPRANNPERDDDGICYPGRVVGYYNNVAARSRTLPLPSSHIPANYYTDIIYSKFVINDRGVVRYADPISDLTLRGIENAISLKGVGRVKRILFTVGDWLDSDDNYIKTYYSVNDTGTINTLSIFSIWHNILTNNVVRNRFVFSAIHIMNLYKFDGIDIEYPWNRFGSEPLAREQEKFISFLRFFRRSLGSTKLLTLGPIASRFIMSNIDHSYELQNIINYANLMVRSDAFSSNSHIQPKELIYKEFTNYLTHYNSSFLNLGILLLGKGYKLAPGELALAENENRLFDMSESSWFVDEHAETREGLIPYVRLLEKYRNSEVRYEKNHGSWALLKSQNAIIAYNDVVDLRELKLIFRSLNLGGLVINSIDYDNIYNGTANSLVGVLYECV